MSLKGRSCWVVNIRMVQATELSLEAIGRFVTCSEEIRFEAEDRQQLYGWWNGFWWGSNTRSWEGGARSGAALHREDDRAEPCAGHAADRRLHSQRARPGDGLSSTAFRATLHTVRHRVAGLGRRSARDAQRPGNTAYPGARVRGLQAAGVRASGYDFRRSFVQPAPPPALPRAAVELHQDAAHGGVDRRTAQASATGSARLSAPGHGASGRSAERRGEGRLSHQCRR